MIFICGLSEYNLSMFHLVNHAFFKALLFLGAGSVIHSVSGEQDIRKFGKLTKFIPFTYSMMLLGFLALAGFPFLSGFYSKDLILETSYAKHSLAGGFSYWLGSLSAGLTAFYSFRVLYYTF
jgi:NADH-ubiquinone oxidoreductase chain 5